jgi:hypothetical protein
VPARLVRDPSAVDAVMLLAAAGIYLTLAAAVFQRGLRRYASGSRFGVFG